MSAANLANIQFSVRIFIIDLCIVACILHFYKTCMRIYLCRLFYYYILNLIGALTKLQLLLLI